MLLGGPEGSTLVRGGRDEAGGGGRGRVDNEDYAQGAARLLREDLESRRADLLFLRRRDARLRAPGRGCRRRRDECEGDIPSVVASSNAANEEGRQGEEKRGRASRQSKASVASVSDAGTKQHDGPSPHPSLSGKRTR